MMAFVLIIGSACAEASIAQGVDHVGKGSPYTQSAESDKRGTEESPLVVNEHPIQSKEEAAEEAHKDAEQNRVNSRIIELTFAIAICAGLQFLGILGQIFVYWRQTSIMKATLTAISGQATTMETQAQEARKSAAQTFDVFKEQTDNLLISAKAATVSAMAAKDSAKAANDQIEMMKEKERARVQVTPLDFDAVDPTEPNKIMIEFVNIGPTNAFDVRVEAGAKVTVDMLKPEQGEYTDLAIPTLLRPEKVESSWVVWDFPRRWRDEIVDDRAKIIFEVVGQIKYRDVFETTHTEDFSYRMNVYGIEDMPRNSVKLKLMRNWHPFDLHPGEWEF